MSNDTNTGSSTKPLDCVGVDPKKQETGKSDFVVYDEAGPVDQAAWDSLVSLDFDKIEEKVLAEVIRDPVPYIKSLIKENKRLRERHTIKWTNAIPIWFPLAWEIHQCFMRLANIEQGQRKAFLALALAGEAGELANLIKKLWRDGFVNEHSVREEIADVRIYTELEYQYFKGAGGSLDTDCADKLVAVKAKLAQMYYERWTKGDFMVKGDKLSLHGLSEFEIGLLAQAAGDKWPDVLANTYEGKLP